MVLRKAKNAPRRVRYLWIHRALFIRQFIWSHVLVRLKILITTNTRNGRLTYSTKDLVIGQHLFAYGHYEADYIDRVVAAVGSSTGRPVMVDVGANLGMTSIAFLLRNAFERAVAIEPDQFNFELLRRNVDQNGLGQRIRCIQAAANDRQGTLGIHRSTGNLGAHYVNVQSPSSGSSVPTDRLDALIRAAGVMPDSVGLVWMDVEGYEGFALDGAAGLLDRVPYFALEIWPQGIARSGYDQAQLLHHIQSRFTSFQDLSAPDPPRSIADFPLTYEQLTTAGRFSQYLFWTAYGSS